MALFSVDIYIFGGPGSTYQGKTPKAFNSEFIASVDALDSRDTVKASAGAETKIVYLEGGSPANPQEYFVAETVSEIVALANGGSAS